MRSLSFDGLSVLYDQTRTADPTCLAAALNWVAARFPPTQFRRLLEPGIGTGRVALPLANRGYQVIGADISEEMLSVCMARNQTIEAASGLHCVRADTISLPFSADAFDLCLAVHLFYFIPKWRQAVQEMLRVLRPGGALILLHTGFGAEVPHLNTRYRELAQNQDYDFPVYGVRSTTEVVEYATSLGCTSERIEEQSWKWVACLRQRDALGYLASRTYSFTKDVPEVVHQSVMDSLRHEADAAGGMDAIIEVPNRISIVVLTPCA